ncbi:hypothetical protein HFN49_35330 [Rhizobium leguminosarum]|uniref:YaaC family protein n=1 Tax=Rhizobium ruizarguesonis TaxID=2081791 RepID=UPI001A98D061|nr:hypothetical protein [Rhizobium ruizarguesonis]MBY5891421.1 hypothetical protein [Rhizobium leguminosarum]QSY99607.1 hypothetical protein J3P73_17395 [Rhizobium ruizarguesonis]
MANFEIHFVKESRGADAIWRRLARFQETERVTERVMAERGIPKNQKLNVRKQMEQLAFSLNQAREYFRSAETSGPTARALMAYYGLIALANAEVLWSGDGMHSFDTRDVRFNAHGFDLVQDHQDLSNFGARPKTDEQGIRGLFGLWRQFATHIPNYAKQTIRYPEGGFSIVYNATSSVTTLREVPCPIEPITLLECLKHIPTMTPALEAYNEQTKLCRGQIEEDIALSEDGKSFKTRTRSYIMHHLTDAAFHDIGSKFKIAPRAVSEFKMNRIGSGLSVVWKANLPEQSLFTLPEVFANTKEELLFIGDGDHLNEFGYYYVALFIAGMITRYYPHIWIKEFRSNSKASTLIDELVDNALPRVPLLTTSALEQRAYLYD